MGRSGDELDCGVRRLRFGFQGLGLSTDYPNLGLQKDYTVG